MDIVAPVVWSVSVTGQLASMLFLGSSTVPEIVSGTPVLVVENAAVMLTKELVSRTDTVTVGACLPEETSAAETLYVAEAYVMSAKSMFPALSVLSVFGFGTPASAGVNDRVAVEFGVKPVPVTPRVPCE